MENINSVVAENLRRLREERRLSLDAAAKLTGVSKSMLGQIERGEANPTVSTVWKIADGLKVSFTALTVRPERDSEVVDVSRVTPLLEDGGRFRNFTAFPFDAARRLRDGRRRVWEHHVRLVIVYIRAVVEQIFRQHPVPGGGHSAQRFPAEFFQIHAEPVEQRKNIRAAVIFQM